MAKRRINGRIAESSATAKLRIKQKKQNRLKKENSFRPEKKEMALIDKIDEIGKLAIKQQEKHEGARVFLDLLVMRRSRGINSIGQMQCPDETKREMIVLGLIANKFPINTEVLKINSWLIGTGKKDLQMTVGEAIELFLL